MRSINDRRRIRVGSNYPHGYARQHNRWWLLWKCWNLFFFTKWNACIHEWEPVGFADWRCKHCGAY